MMASINAAYNKSHIYYGRRVVWALCCLGLVACTTTTHTEQHDNRTAWQKSKDSAPARSIDVSAVADAQPQPVKRTRAGNNPSYRVLGKTYNVLEDSKGYRKRGYASWYGTKFHGRRTANGEIYDMYAMTAAHKTLPIPSYVRVTNVENGLSVIVRINDRGPFHGDRIIDLSYAAAIKLGYQKQGVALVDVVDVTPSNGAQASTSGSVNNSAHTNKPKQITATKGVYVQLGAFQQAAAAENVLAQVQPLLQQGTPIGIFMGADQWHRVRIGPIRDPKNIAAIKQRLSQQGFPDTHIVYPR